MIVKGMAGTTGLEPPTSDVTGRRLSDPEAGVLSFSVCCADREPSLFRLLQYVLRFSTTTLCQI